MTQICRRRRSGTAPAPAWVLSGASADLDFINNQYWGGTIGTLLNFTRASNGTDLLPTSASGAPYTTFTSNNPRITATLGLLVEGGRTNQLLNSTVPATQTTASLGTGSYTLWVNGSGSALASAGTATITGAASASNGSPNVFSVTGAGTVTVTVTGSLNAFQLEAGAFGSSLIVTAGTTVARAGDSALLAGTALAVLQGTARSFYIQSNLVVGPAAGRIFGSGGSSGYAEIVTTTSNKSFNGTNSVVATYGSGTQATIAKNAGGYSASGRSLVINNGTVATDANTLSTQAVASLGAQAGNSNFGYCYIGRVATWNSRLSDVTLKGLTV